MARSADAGLARATGKAVRRRPVIPLLVLAVAAAGTAGCSGGSKRADATVTPSISADCISPTSAAAKQIVHYATADGQEVEAYVAGPAAGKHVSSSGTVGIVIVHQANQDLCDSASWAMKFSGLGYLAIAPTLDGIEPVGEIGASVAYLRQHGAKQVVLLGASMGGTAVLQTAVELKPPVQAVVSVSGPSAYSSMDALSAVPKLTVPVFYSAGALDTDFAFDETNLYHATTEKDKVLDIMPGDSSHGFDLLDALMPRVKAFFLEHIH
jgi:dienelactone hydrolase